MSSIISHVVRTGHSGTPARSRRSAPIIPFPPRYEHLSTAKAVLVRTLEMTERLLASAFLYSVKSKVFSEKEGGHKEASLD